MMFHGDDNEHERRRFTRRLVVLGVGQLAGFAVLAGRLYQLQVRDQRQYGALADANRTMRQVLPPLRGRIFDRNGRILADTEESFQAILTPTLAGDVEMVLDRVDRIRRLDEAARAQLRAAVRRQRPNEPIVVFADLTWQEVAALNFHAPLLPGIDTHIAGKRVYRNPPVMGRIVGYVGRVARFAMDDDPVLRLSTVRVGKSGVERGLEGRLRGDGGYIVREVDSRRRIVRTLKQADARRGSDVAVTVDPALQQRLIGRLARHRRAAAAVIDIASGDVVALGASPAFDVSRLSAPISEAAWRKVREAQGDPLVDRSFQGVYPPGSTFKMVTALAALEAGVIDRSEQITCRGSYVLSGQRFRCWNRGGHGPCALHRALRESCDVYFYEVARRVGIDRLAAMARRLGFGAAYRCGLEPIKGGLVPDPDWKRGRYGKRWYEGETLLAGIGQGYVLATPLQLAVMTARLASGRRVVPTVVHPRLDEGAAGRPLGVGQDHLEAVQRGMFAAVNEGRGTGKKARLDDQRFAIYGKTGTSQVARISSSVARSKLPWRLRDHALFAGYVADERPRYAVAAIVEHGGSGGKVAAPLVREIVEDAIALDPAARPVFDVTAGGHLAGNAIGAKER